MYSLQHKHTIQSIMICKTIYFDKIKKNVEFYIGENAQENQDIVLYAAPEDLWFHLAGRSSPHVLAVTRDMQIDRRFLHAIVVQGYLLCKQNSKSKSEKNVDIIYTKIKNVIPTETIGMVETTNVNHIRM